MPVVMETRGVDVGNVQTAPMFRITDGDDHIVGDLIVSTGGLYWRSRNQQHYHMVTWQEADELFGKHPTTASVDR